MGKLEARDPMAEDIRDFFLSMADELRTAPDAPSDLLLRRVRRRRLRTVGAAVLALAVVSGGTFGAIRAFGGVHRPAPAQEVCSSAWTEPQNPAAKLNGYFGDIAGISPEDLWVVGSVIGSFPKVGHPIVQHWDGERWSLVGTPDLPAAGLTAVAAVSASDVWAVGDRWSGGTLVEHWDGARWSVVPSPNLIAGPRWGSGFSAIAASSASDIWAVGDAANGRTSRPLIEHWDGTSWRLVPTPEAPSNSSLSDVAVVSADDVWAVGESWSGHGWQTLTMHWSGSAWTVVPSPNTDERVTGLSGVAGLSADHVWAVGSSSKLSGETVRPIVMHWDGTAWSLVQGLPSELPYGLEAVDAVRPNDVWAADKSPTYAYALHWDGSSWSLIAPPGGPIEGGRLTGIVAFPSGRVVAVGRSSVENGMSPLAVQMCASSGVRPSG
jgi:hypothetical protein